MCLLNSLLSDLIPRLCCRSRVQAQYNLLPSNLCTEMISAWCGSLLSGAVRFPAAPQEQRAHGQDSAAAGQQQRLERQCRMSGLLKRAVILHGGKLVALTAWWAAMQRPGAIGCLYVGAHALASPYSDYSPPPPHLFPNTIVTTRTRTHAHVRTCAHSLPGNN